MLLRLLLPVAALGLAACGSQSVGTDTTSISVADATTATERSDPAASTTASETAVSLSYTLEGVEGLAPREEPRLTQSSDDETVLAWSSTTGITDAFIVLRDRPAPPTKSPEGDISLVPLDVPSGTAFIATDNGVAEPIPTSATRVMWWRTDGRLWVVSNFGVVPERLAALALKIQPGSGVPFVLPDPSMTLIGVSSLATYQSVGQTWSLDGSTIGLAVTTGGLAQHLDVPVVAVAERTVAGEVGYELTLPNGQRNVIWPTDDPDRWGSLVISPTLASRVDEIVAAIVAR
jgi:hypothetical protein